MIHRNVEFAVTSGGLLLLHLHRRGFSACFTRNGHVRSSGSRRGSAIPAVVAHAIDRGVVVRDCGVVCIVDNRRIHVCDGGVVAIDISLPPATVKTFTGISISVINPAVETDLRCPITRIPAIPAINPCPITRSPEQTWVGRQDPRAGYPIMLFCIWVPSPVAWCPDVPFTRAERLVIDRKRWWADAYDNCNLS